MTAWRPAITAALLLAAFTCGLFFTGYRDIIYAPAVILLMLAACTAIIPAFRSSCNIPFGTAPLLLFVLWLYITISLSWSTVPFASTVTWLVFIALPVSFFMLSMPQERRSFILAAASTLLVSLSILGGWAIVQVLFLSVTYGARAHHPLPNANDLAALLNLGLFPLLALLLFRTADKDKLFYAAATGAILLCGGLFATQSRSGFLIALAAFSVLLFLLRPPIKRIMATLGIGAGLFIIMQFSAGWGFAGRLAQLGAPALDPNVTSRFSLWESTLRMMRDHPWGGTGFGTFYLYYPRYREPLADNSAGFFAHNDFLQFGAETGIVATFLLYVLAGTIILRTFFAIRNTDRNAPHRAAAAGFFCGLFTLVLHAHAGFPLYIMPALIVAGVWLAAWHDAATQSAFGERGYTPLDMVSWQRPVLALSVLAIAGLVSLMAASSAAGQYYLLRTNNDIGKGQVEDFIANIERAEKWAPPAFIDPEVQIAGFYIDTIGAAGILFPMEEKQGMFDSASALLDLAASMNPAWAEVDFKRGKLYDITGDKERAAASWRAALKKNPTHFRARTALAKALVARGRPAEAYDLLVAGLMYPHDANVTREYGAMMKSMSTAADIQKSYLRSEEQAP